MALQNVPWAIGNGAHNQVEGARLSLYAATGGRGGVMSPTDMRVTALPVPGGAVRVHTGGVVIVSGYPGASSQAYAARETSSTDVEIDATGSSGARTRYLVVRVHDHQYSGEPTPSNVQDGPYNAYEWISQDPRTTTLPYPVEGIAKVVQPPNTGTITDAMIEDIRELAQPKTDVVPFARPRVHEDDDAVENYLTRRADDGGEYFPGGSGYANSATFLIPDWATHMMIEADWMSLRVVGGKNSWGTFWIEYGDEYRPRTWPNSQNYEFATQRFFWDTVGAGSNYTTNWRLITQSLRVPAKLRGKRVTFVFKAGVSPASPEDNAVFMDALGGLGLKLTLSQEPIGPEAY